MAQTLSKFQTPPEVSPLDLRRDLKPKGRKRTEMNKLIKMVTIVAGFGAMLSFAGCGAKAPDQVALDVLQRVQAGTADTAFLEEN